MVHAEIVAEMWVELGPQKAQCCLVLLITSWIKACTHWWLYYGGASPETMYCSAAQKGLFSTLKILLVLLIPLDKISANYHAVTNEAFDLG